MKTVVYTPTEQVSVLVQGAAFSRGKMWRTVGQRARHTTQPYIVTYNLEAELLCRTVEDPDTPTTSAFTYLKEGAQ